MGFSAFGACDVASRAGFRAAAWDSRWCVGFSLAARGMCATRGIPAAWDFATVGFSRGAWDVRHAWDPGRVGFPARVIFSRRVGCASRAWDSSAAWHVAKVGFSRGAWDVRHAWDSPCGSLSARGMCVTRGIPAAWDSWWDFLAARGMCATRVGSQPRGIRDGEIFSRRVGCAPRVGFRPRGTSRRWDFLAARGMCVVAGARDSGREGFALVWDFLAARGMFATTLRPGDRGATFQNYSKTLTSILSRPHPHAHLP